MEVENVEDIVQKQNHATENCVQVILFVQVLHPSLCESLKDHADGLNVVGTLFLSFRILIDVFPSQLSENNLLVTL